jgi:hypothetical protein
MSNILLPPRTARDVERSLTHFDQDYELAYYSQRKMVRDPRSGMVGAVATGSDAHVMDLATRAAISPLALWSQSVKATLFTGIPAELLYHDIGTANTSVAGTAAEVVMNLYNPFGQSANLPAGFWQAGGAGGAGVGRFAKVVLRGIVTTAAVAGTAIFTTRMGAVQSTAATIVGITPTTVPATPAAQTLGMWEQELDIELQSFGTATAAAVCRGLGKVGMPGWASPNTAQLTWSAMTGQTAASNGLTTATVDITATNYLSFNQTCTAATITAIQLLQAFVYGMG